VPALWTSDSSGQWTTLSNWNSGQTPIAPVQGPGQVPRVGTLVLPTVRLPGSNDTVILDRPNADITVTLASGAHTIRKLEVREALHITGGSLTVNYAPSADSTPISARFSAPVSLQGGSLSVHTLQVDATQTLSLGGTLTCNTIHLIPHSSTPAKIVLVDDVTFNPLGGATATIANGAGTGNSGFIDLGGGDRAWHVSNGAAAVDLAIGVPVVNGAFTKSGNGTLAINGASSYTGDTRVLEGTLRIGNPFLFNTADVYLSTGATLNLNFTGNPDIVDSLFFDGISKESGIWGAVGSGAPYTSPFITGTGFLQVLTYIAPIPGDFNHSGAVDGDDFAQWLDDFGTNDQSDTDQDGDSDGFDFLIWQRHFGSGDASLAVSQAVPEPSAILLLGAFAAVGLFKSVRSRRGF